VEEDTCRVYRQQCSRSMNLDVRDAGELDNIRLCTSFYKYIHTYILYI
jgi:hypothetical protein